MILDTSAFGFTTRHFRYSTTQNENIAFDIKIVEDFLNYVIIS